MHHDVATGVQNLLLPKSPLLLRGTHDGNCASWNSISIESNYKKYKLQLFAIVKHTPSFRPAVALIASPNSTPSCRAASCTISLLYLLIQAPVPPDHSFSRPRCLFLSTFFIAFWTATCNSSRQMSWCPSTAWHTCKILGQRNKVFVTKG
jgi:hypothetical protein